MSESRHNELKEAPSAPNSSTLSTLPQALIYHGLFQYLDIKDLSKLNTANKSLQQLTDSYSPVRTYIEYCFDGKQGVLPEEILKTIEALYEPMLAKIRKRKNNLWLYGLFKKDFHEQRLVKEGFILDLLLSHFPESDHLSVRRSMIDACEPSLHAKIKRRSRKRFNSRALIPVLYNSFQENPSIQLLRNSIRAYLTKNERFIFKDMHTLFPKDYRYKKLRALELKITKDEPINELEFSEVLFETFFELQKYLASSGISCTFREADYSLSLKPQTLNIIEWYFLRRQYQAGKALYEEAFLELCREDVSVRKLLKHMNSIDGYLMGDEKHRLSFGWAILSAFYYAFRTLFVGAFSLAAGIILDFSTTCYYALATVCSAVSSLKTRNAEQMKENAQSCLRRGASFFARTLLSPFLLLSYFIKGCAAGFFVKRDNSNIDLNDDYIPRALSPGRPFFYYPFEQTQECVNEAEKKKEKLASSSSSTGRFLSCLPRCFRRSATVRPDLILAENHKETFPPSAYRGNEPERDSCGASLPSPN